MLRCNPRRFARRRAGLALVALLAFATAAPAQVQRNFPQNALRGEIAFTDPPEVRLNGSGARLAPGLRLRGPDNLLLVSGAVAGLQARVLYTVDTLGLVKDVWILRNDEATGLWPATPLEAQQWRFDPAAQLWSRP
ncbi:MAG TPA: hypothetical protein VFR90_17415 [Methylibium sp.]|uniref:hypothetical protein n=1 Tax=Methylibium sp. TaxID=2067992 RepID=UPI002DBD3AB3|nr:hypothetical protein [Methylibium sp.]HEU4460903.1 hypothetical protein [Methylibium sp.]